MRLARYIKAIAPAFQRACPRNGEASLDRHAQNSYPIVFVWRQVSPATDAEMAPSLLWFATIQCIESKQDLARLAPKDGFIAAEPVERVAGQIGQTQTATCEVDCVNGFRPRDLDR